MLRANQDVNSLLHQKRLETLKREKERERQIASIQNHKKLEIERKLKEQEDNLVYLKNKKQRLDIVN